jgi:hypothetical protein
MKQCLDPHSEAFPHATRFLGSMASHGRADAGIFLLGLLRYYKQDLTMAAVIVESLGNFADRRTIDALIAELHRVPSSNATRRYLGSVIAALETLPPSLVADPFRRLADDRSFSSRRRTRFIAIADDFAHHIGASRYLEHDT